MAAVKKCNFNSGGEGRCSALPRWCWACPWTDTRIGPLLEWFPQVDLGWCRWLGLIRRLAQDFPGCEELAGGLGQSVDASVIEVRSMGGVGLGSFLFSGVRRARLDVAGGGGCYRRGPRPTLFWKKKKPEEVRTHSGSGFLAPTKVCLGSHPVLTGRTRPLFFSD